MRARHWLLGVSAGLLAAGFFGGCGGSESQPNAPREAGPADVAIVDVAVEAKSDVVEAAVPMCAVDADITKLDIPDASLADGATSIGLCSDCVQAKCGAQLKACDDDCDCKEAVLDFFTCYSKSQSLTKCGAGLITLSGSAQKLGSALLLCIQPESGCNKECAVGSFTMTDAGKDATPDATPDAPSDSNSDAPADATSDSPADSPSDAPDGD